MADLVVVMRGGAAVEVGSYGELLAAGGVFAALMKEAQVSDVWSVLCHVAGGVVVLLLCVCVCVSTGHQLGTNTPHLTPRPRMQRWPQMMRATKQRQQLAVAPASLQGWQQARQGQHPRSCLPRQQRAASSRSRRRRPQAACRALWWLRTCARSAGFLRCSC
jgi:hypothetical protein